MKDDNDHYNCRWVCFLVKHFIGGGFTAYAITLGQTTFYSYAREDVGVTLWAHEEYHKLQWRRAGKVKFALCYVWFLLRYGYWNNPYEVDARKAEWNAKWTPQALKAQSK
jgi:hypothetical protein